MSNCRESALQFWVQVYDRLPETETAWRRVDEIAKFLERGVVPKKDTATSGSGTTITLPWPSPGVNALSNGATDYVIKAT